jgi:hypothetical protein
MRKTKIKTAGFTFRELGSEPLAQLLQLRVAPFADEDDHARQLRFVETHIRTLRCKTLLIEDPYVDRDYMEEHAVFYSRTLNPIPNYCTRVHFFTAQKDALQRRLKKVVRALGTPRYGQACAELNESYLGFSIIKPLPGSPVGRTVLRPRTLGESYRCIAKNPVHVLGAQLSVEGIGFQQQDAGVSACATTAVWACLQNAGAFETIAPAAPAQITILASRSLPYGRAMPSEGLSTGQMCDAVQGVGLAPNLIRIKDRAHALRLLFAIVLSGFAPVLILTPSKRAADQSGPSEDDPRVGATFGDEKHAVTLVGAQLRSDYVLDADSKGPFVAAATLLRRLIVHDDRIGPYVPATFDARHEDAIIELEPAMSVGTEVRRRWRLTHVLLALHPKIRLSFGGLQLAASRVMERMMTALSPSHSQLAERDAIFVENWIEHGYKYVNDLAEHTAKNVFPWEVFTTFRVPRYVAVVRFAGERIGMIDVVIDTTSTERNLVVLALIVHRDRGTETEAVAQALEQYLHCRILRL